MGKVVLVVADVAPRKGIENPFALSRATGLAYPICHRIWNGQQSRIDLNTLAKLCDALKAKPGQLFEYTAD
jgi:DNA-binding Xre family transcriptional regulator